MCPAPRVNRRKTSTPTVLACDQSIASGLGQEAALVHTKRLVVIEAADPDLTADSGPQPLTPDVPPFQSVRTHVRQTTRAIRRYPAIGMVRPIEKPDSGCSTSAAPQIDFERGFIAGDLIIDEQVSATRQELEPITPSAGWSW
jgi:hypothetical protein